MTVHSNWVNCNFKVFSPQSGSVCPVVGNASFCTAAGNADDVYVAAADCALEALMEHMEALEEAHETLNGVDYSDGVLTIEFEGVGTYVVNKQAPNRQLWLSSPVSGPWHFDLRGGEWVCTRGGISLHSRLSAEVSEVSMALSIFLDGE